MSRFFISACVSCSLPLASLLALCLTAGAQRTAAAEDARGYVVIASQATAEHETWSRVVAALVKKHDAELVTYDSAVSQTLPELQTHFPKYVGFVARPEEAGRQYVADVHRLTRRLDDDPYTDVLWGIVTGYTPQAALAIVNTAEPLTVQRVAAGTEVALTACPEGVWYCELKQHRLVRKIPGSAPAEERGPPDTTALLAAALGEYKSDLLVTSGHATERDWQIGYAYRNGEFRCADGQVYGLDTKGAKHPVTSQHPRVYLAVGNCLMGHIDSRDAMALAFMNCAGVRQMAGYTVLTWYGYAGWGMLDYFVEQPGRYSLAEAFFANQQSLIHRLETHFPEIARLDTEPGSIYRGKIAPGESGKAAGLSPHDGAGLLHDRDVLAFYGDPAWDARLAAGPLAWKQTLTEDAGVFTLRLEPQLGAASFDAVNTNGSQRGGRAIVAFLPRRIGAAEVLSGGDLHPVVTDDFVLVPHPGKCDPSRAYEVSFKELSAR